jgi:hypothetical protein
MVGDGSGRDALSHRFMIGSKVTAGGMAAKHAGQRGNEVRPVTQRRVGLDAFHETVDVPGLGSRGELDACSEGIGEQFVSVEVCPSVAARAEGCGEQ